MEQKSVGHTPGPWTHVQHGRAIQAKTPAGSDFTFDTFTVAEVVSGGSGIEAADANGDLIAAAPDLLAALHKIGSQSWSNDQEALECIRYARETARAAIAKARGEARA